MNDDTKKSVRTILKKIIDDHSCNEVLEVGFRRGVEWFVLESGLYDKKELLEKLEFLEKENCKLKESLERQVQP